LSSLILQKKNIEKDENEELSGDVPDVSDLQDLLTNRDKNAASTAPFVSNVKLDETSEAAKDRDKLIDATESAENVDDAVSKTNIVNEADRVFEPDDKHSQPVSKSNNGLEEDEVMSDNKTGNTVSENDHSNSTAQIGYVESKVDTDIKVTDNEHLDANDKAEIKESNVNESVEQETVSSVEDEWADAAENTHDIVHDISEQKHETTEKLYPDLTDDIKHLAEESRENVNPCFILHILNPFLIFSL